MKITIKEALDLQIWEGIAEIGGFSIWAVNEGVDMDLEVEVTVQQFRNLMENVTVSAEELSWCTTKAREGNIISYRNSVLNHGDHISISKNMSINGETKRVDLVHIPMNVVSEIEKWIQDDKSKK